MVWTAHGIEAVQLPLPEEDKTRMRLCQRYRSLAEAAPPAVVRAAIDGVIALLEGKPIDLSGVVLALDSVGEFDRRVYDIARTIPPRQHDDLWRHRQTPWRR